MRTKLPTELVHGDLLSAYDERGQRVTPVFVFEADRPVAGTVFVTTANGPLRMNATLPVEIEA